MKRIEWLGRCPHRYLMLTTENGDRVWRICKDEEACMRRRRAAEACVNWIFEDRYGMSYKEWASQNHPKSLPARLRIEADCYSGDTGRYTGIERKRLSCLACILDRIQADQD